MQKINILTACNKEYMEILYNSNIPAYAKKWGYDFKVFKKENYFNVRGFKGWVKVLAIRELLRDTDDWILWIDADSIITDMNKPVSDFIDNNYDMIISEFQPDAHEVTIYKNILHTGAFLIKRSDWIHNMIAAWYNCDEKFYEGYKYAVDEGALLEAIKDDSSRIKVLAQSTICSTYRDKYDNSFIVHLAAWFPTIDDKIIKMQELRREYNV